MNSSKKIVSGIGWSVVLNIIGAVYGFVSVPILINYFGKGEYGLIGLATSVNVYMQLMDMGLNSTNIRFFSTWLAKGEKEKAQTGFQVSLFFYGVIGLLNAAILLIISYFSNDIFNLTSHQNIVIKNLFYILAISAIVNWYSSSFDQLISATENVGWIKKRSLLPKGLQILVLIVTILCRLDLEMYFFLSTFVILTILPLSVHKIKKELPFISFLPKWDASSFKEILPYSLNIFSFSIFQFLFFQSRPVFLGIQGNTEMVADYQILIGITGLITMISSPFIGALLPSTSKAIAENNKDAYYRVAYDGTKYISLVISFLCFGLMTVGYDLMQIYVGSKFLFLVPWLYFSIILQLSGHNQAISSLILAGSNIRPLTYSSIVASLVGLTAMWLTIPYFHVGGTVIGYLAYTIIQEVFYYFYYWPRILMIDSKRVFLKSLLPYLVIGSTAVLFCNFVLPHTSNSWINVFYIGSVFSVLFLVMAFVTFNQRDKLFFRSLINRKNG